MSGYRQDLFFVLMCMAFMGSLLQAQQSFAQEQPAANIKVRVEAVSVAAVVTDHSGKHIAGLKADDFVVRENGVRQRIAAVDEVRTTAAPFSQPGPEHDIVTNDLTAPGAQRRISVVVLDLLHMNFSDQAYGRDQLKKFLLKWDRQEPVALVTISCLGVRLIHDFTRDTGAMLDALAKVNAQAATAMDDDFTYAGDTNIASIFDGIPMATFTFGRPPNPCGERSNAIEPGAVEQVAAGMRGLSGRKALIWISTSAPGQYFDRDFFADFDAATDWRNDWAQVSRNLADSQIAVYPIDVRGLVARTPSTPTSLHAPARDDSFAFDYERHRLMREVAETTGGRAFYNRNDIDNSIRLATEDSSSYYLVTYYRDITHDFPGWKSLKVEVPGHGARLRARTGFVVPGPSAPEKTRASDLEFASNAIFELRALPLELRLRRVSNASGGRTFEFVANLRASAIAPEPDDNNRVRLDWVAVLRRNGKVAGTLRKAVDTSIGPADLAQYTKDGLTYGSSISVNADDAYYELRVIARDVRTGRMGTVTVSLNRVPMP